MRKIIFLFTTVCVLLAFLVVSPVLAQEDLTETFVAEDGSYQFSYPAGWEVDTSSTFVQITSPVENGSLLVVFYIDPNTIATLAPDAKDPTEAMAAMRDFLELIASDPAESASGGRPAALAALKSDSSEGIGFMIEFDTGQYGLMMAIAPPGTSEAYFDLMIALAESFGPVTGDVSGGKADTISGYDGEWPSVVAELEDKGLISSGGSLVFQENTTFFSGQGTFFTPLARRLPFADIVMAGELNFTVGAPGEFETCSLLARITTNSQGTATSFIDVGFVNDGTLIVQDRFSASEDPNLTAAPQTYDLDQPHHILFLLQDDEFTLYVDGELAIEDYTVVDRTGTYGIALRGQGPGARCEGNNVWAYEALAFKPGVCEANSPNTVNKRSGPGTSYDRAGQLNGGTVVGVIGKAEASDGFIWWQLEDETWVRDDVIAVTGDCAGIPVVDE